MAESAGVSPGTLYIVATPIGHLDDITRRALTVLAQVDVIAAEDTRHSRRLLEHYDIRTPLVSFHEHSEGQRLARLCERLAKGESIALISDAGTPLISDPGYRLVREARLRELPVVPLPGPCALAAALSVSGLPSDRFSFEGFLPAKQAARRGVLEGLARDPRTLIFYEAPHRIVDSLADLQAIFGGDREAVLARELTKHFETVKLLPLAALHEWVLSDDNQQRGEIVLLVRGYSQAEQQGPGEVATRVLSILQRELPLKQAAALAAEITGEKKNALYAYALDAQRKAKRD